MYIHVIHKCCIIMMRMGVCFGLLVVSPKPDLCPSCLVVCYFLYYCQHVTKRRDVICKVHISQPPVTPLDSKTSVVHRFSLDKVDVDEEEKNWRECNPGLPLAGLNRNPNWKAHSQKKCDAWSIIHIILFNYVDRRTQRSHIMHQHTAAWSNFNLRVYKIK